MNDGRGYGFRRGILMSWGRRVAQEYGGNGEGLGGLKGGHRGRIGERGCLGSWAASTVVTAGLMAGGGR
jgi:hypothetical protein